MANAETVCGFEISCANFDELVRQGPARVTARPSRENACVLQARSMLATLRDMLPVEQMDSAADVHDVSRVLANAADALESLTRGLVKP